MLAPAKFLLLPLSATSLPERDRIEVGGDGVESIERELDSSATNEERSRPWVLKDQYVSEAAERGRTCEDESGEERRGRLWRELLVLRRNRQSRKPVLVGSGLTTSSCSIFHPFSMFSVRHTIPRKANAVANATKNPLLVESRNPVRANVWIRAIS